MIVPTDKEKLSLKQIEALGKRILDLLTEGDGDRLEMPASINSIIYALTHLIIAASDGSESRASTLLGTVILNMSLNIHHNTRMRTICVVEEVIN